MTVRDTSLEAYWSEKLSQRVNAQQAAVLENLAVYGQATRAALSTSLDFPINVICGRVNELKNMGLVSDDKTVISEDTGKKVHVVELTSEA